ncbi:hypothetical protein HPB48_027088 [Haemaphysalis longicornis]|uniref:BACK domain-containing protein n=1 Tax=Haemaphysalis longicornis TaxID=44386 RepID=A0A9J6HD28_HAELO|nr:hypothetical protein HPB48_027088 [Haemaphysalis longicornis]
MIPPFFFVVVFFRRMMYGNIDILNDCVTALLIKVASRKYMFSDALEYAENFLVEHVKPEDVCDLLDLHVKLNEPDIDISVLNALRSIDAELAIAEPRFLSCEWASVYIVAKNIRNVNELSLITRIYHWCCENEVYDDEHSSLRALFWSFFSQMRVLSLTLEEVLNGPCRWGVFSAEEQIEVLSAIADKANVVPDFINPCRQSRYEY